MENKSEIWYSFLGGKSEDDNISYYDNKDFFWVKLLEKNVDVIKKEVCDFIEGNEREMR